MEQEIYTHSKFNSLKVTRIDWRLKIPGEHNSRNVVKVKITRRSLIFNNAKLESHSSRTVTEWGEWYKCKRRWYFSHWLFERLSWPLLFVAHLKRLIFQQFSGVFVICLIVSNVALLSEINYHYPMERIIFMVLSWRKRLESAICLAF